MLNNIDIGAFSAQPPLKAPPAPTSDAERADKVAAEFEEMAFGHLVKQMFATSEGSALWGEGLGADIARSMFIDAIAKSGGAKSLNLKEAVKKSLYANGAIDFPPDLAKTEGGFNVVF